MQKYDVVIVGGGMVGLTLALAITKDSALTVAVIDQQAPEPLSDEAELRVSAINAASQHIFENIGVWSHIEKRRHTPYNRMHVWEKDSLGKIEFNRDDVQRDELGWIIENNVIRQSLWQKVEETNAITLITGHKIQQLAVGESEVFLSFEQHLPITTKLIVGADGARSWVREQCDFALTFWDYDHHALVATVNCELGHQDTAWQVFLPDGPLALLPLFKSNQCSIVWSQSPDNAERLRSLGAEQFAKEITAASDGKLGMVSLASERICFPLTMRYARDFVKERVALVGDAAHTIHPLAGQGVNLGLLDAASLAQTIIEANNDNKDIGELSAIASYGRWRKSQAADMVAAMEIIKRGFTIENPIVKAVRSVGMSVLNEISPIKQLMIKQALGEKSDLPILAVKPDPLA